MAGEARAGDGDDGQEQAAHAARMNGQPAHDADVAPLDGFVDPVEAAEEGVHPALTGVRLEVERALRRVQRQRDQRADDGGGGNDEGELAEHLAGDPGQERRRQEHRGEDEGDAQDRPRQLAHGLDDRVPGREPLLDVARAVLDDHDRVVDDDADGEDEREQGHQVDGEAERGHCREGADDRHRHRDERHQHGARVLQEEHDDDQHQHPGLDQCQVDAVDRIADERRGVEQRGVLEARRKLLAHLRH